MKKNNEMRVNKYVPSYRNSKLKGQYVVLEKLNIQDIHEVIILLFSFYNGTSKVFSEENKVPRPQSEARKVAGSV